MEINVRDSCFYPDQPGRNYITVRGFRMCHAATQWAAPTAEQIGLIGTHWSKGWIIENNVISDSKCSGITLGKDRKTGHNVWTNDPSKDGATHYNEVIVRALESGLVTREDRLPHRPQQHHLQLRADRHLRQPGRGLQPDHRTTTSTTSGPSGNSPAPKWPASRLHAAIDVLIRNNRIHHAGRGLWMDWMAQGTRITGNLCYDNSTDDLFVEVDHGPFLVDNNLFLSGISLRDMSEGGAYVHNLIDRAESSAGPSSTRSTPYHPAHSTALAGLSNIKGGDNRFYNNILIGSSTNLSADAHSWDSRASRALPRLRTVGLRHPGSLRFRRAETCTTARRGLMRRKRDPLVVSDRVLTPVIVDQGDEVFLQMEIGPEWKKAGATVVTTELAGGSSNSATSLRECRRFGLDRGYGLLWPQKGSGEAVGRALREPRPGGSAAQTVVTSGIGSRFVTVSVTSAD